MRITPAWRVFAISGAIAAASTFPGLLFLDQCDQKIILNAFQDHLREPLFSGLLTVAAFLFSLKTFIIVTMKENVYATKEYGERLDELKKLDNSLKRYGPLEDFSTLLFLSVLISLSAAVIQFTVGLFDRPWAAAISIDSAIWSLIMILVSLLYMQRNLWAWFKILDGPSK